MNSGSKSEVRRASRDERWNTTFVMTADDLQQVAALFERNFGSVLRFSATAIDGFERKFETVERLLEGGNPSSRMIKELEVMARDPATGGLLWVTFSTERGFGESV